MGEDARQGGGTFEGTSKDGNLQEALQDAINKLPPANFTQWELVGISGRIGGFVGENSVTVTIRVGNS